MPALGLGLSLAKLLWIGDFVAPTAPATRKLQDPDTGLWYPVRVLDSTIEGKNFDFFDGTPTTPGTDPSWIIDHDGTKYEWAILMTPDGLVLDNRGISGAAVTPIDFTPPSQIPATVTGDMDGGEPVLTIT